MQHMGHVIETQRPQVIFQFISQTELIQPTCKNKGINKNDMVIVTSVITHFQLEECAQSSHIYNSALT